MVTRYKNIVVGSGPSALGAVLGLIERGETDILVLDAGRKLSSEGQSKKDLFSRSSNSAKFIWDLLKESSKTPGLVEKKSWGDDFAYAGSSDYTGITTRDLLGSHAFGGLSQVWGTAVCEYSEEDIRDWPIQFDELKKYYKKARQWIPISKFGQDVFGETRLNQIFQVDSDGFQKENIETFDATVALQSKKCTSCGGCLTGCYQDALFSSAHVFQDLIQQKKIKYIEGQVVKDLLRDGDYYQLISVDGKFHGKNIFLAMGCLHSTKFIADIGKKERRFPFQDTAYLLAPAITWRRAGNEKKSIPVVQKFLRYKNIHVQVYGFSQHIKLEIYNKLPRFIFFRDKIAETLSRHFIIFQIFFDSRDSYNLELKYDLQKLSLDKIEVQDRLIPLKSSLLLAMGRALRMKGVFLLSFLMKLAPVGRSFHYGGTMPMGKMTDKWGQLPELPKLFVVDGSIFPSIPSRTILFTLFANAMRIGHEAPLND